MEEMQFWKPSDCRQEKLHTVCRNVLVSVVAIVYLHTTGITLRYESIGCLNMYIMSIKQVSLLCNLILKG